jgi:hypothetical protein
MQQLSLLVTPGEEHLEEDRQEGVFLGLVDRILSARDSVSAKLLEGVEDLDSRAITLRVEEIVDVD